jgi:hypothetical protein
MRLLTNRRRGALWIHAWAPSTVTSSVRRVVKGCLSVLVILVTSNWRGPSFILVLSVPLAGTTSSSCAHICRFHRESEKDPREYLCKLWKAESRHRESRLPFLYSFRTPTSQFSGGSLHIPWRTPNPYHVSSLDNRGRSSFPGGGSCSARFRSLDRRVDPIASARCIVGHEVAW